MTWKGRLIRGWCFKCRNKGIRSELYDAYYCIVHDEWLESTCRDPGCLYCVSRPIKPSYVARTIPEDFNS